VNHSIEDVGMVLTSWSFNKKHTKSHANKFTKLVQRSSIKLKHLQTMWLRIQVSKINRRCHEKKEQKTDEEVVIEKSEEVVDKSLLSFQLNL
jgi:hypothetical protein